jgi:hypothetical protein
MKPTHLVLHGILRAAARGAESVFNVIWRLVRWSVPYGIAFALAVVGGVVLKILDDSENQMGPALGQYYAKRALQENAHKAYCVDPKYAHQVKAAYDEMDRKWRFTYSITEPGFESAEIYITVDAYQRYWLTGSDSLYRIQPQVRHWFGSCRR